MHVRAVDKRWLVLVPWMAGCWAVNNAYPWDGGDMSSPQCQSSGSWVRELVGNPNQLSSVWASGPNDVWAVGANGTILHRTNGPWTLVQPPPVNVGLIKVWGRGPTDVWIVGSMGTILHYDGMQWTSWQSSLTTMDLRAIWGPPDGDEVWVIGSQFGAPQSSLVLHHTGAVPDAGWSIDSPSPYSSLYLDGLGGDEAGGVYAVGESSMSGYGVIKQWSGSSWMDTQMNPTDPVFLHEDLYDVWGSSGQNVWWAVGIREQASTGHILRSTDRTNWSDTGNQGDWLLQSVRGCATGAVWAVGQEDGTQFIMYDRGQQWNVDLDHPKQSGVLSGVWPSCTTSDVWAVGYDAVESDAGLMPTAGTILHRMCAP